MKIFWGLVLFMGMVQICAAEFAVQVGAYTDPANATKTIERLQSEGYPAVFDIFTNQSGAKFQCVMAGPYSTRKEAQNALAKLKLSGWTGFVRTYQPAAGVKPDPIPSEKITPAPAPTQPPPTPEPSTPKSEPTAPTAPPPAVTETQSAPEIEKPTEE
ncbi:SPOR domain-containing protein, partial [bacterium]|nr:SPOR domain-containing protein [bacterium]